MPVSKPAKFGLLDPLALRERLSDTVAACANTASTRVRESIVRIVALAFRPGFNRDDGRKNTSDRKVLDFISELLSHVDECGLDASELDFTLVDVLEELVVLVYLGVVFTRSVGDIVETLLKITSGFCQYDDTMEGEQED